ncbi:hypothetical protein ACWDYJ_32535 [Streptomyces sp. NPDC003042]
MSTPPPNPYSGAPVPPNPYAGAPVAQNPYAGHSGAPVPPGNPYGPPAGHPAQGTAYAAPYPSAPAPGCRNCGAAHAADFSVRAHVGLVLAMRFHNVKGPFCHQCGRAMVRAMTTKTLVQGWWSPFSLVLFTPFTLLWNLIAFLKFNKLPPSAPAPGRLPLDEGPPVLSRPFAYVALLPLIWAVWAVIGIANSG